MKNLNETMSCEVVAIDAVVMNGWGKSNSRRIRRMGRSAGLGKPVT